MLLNNAKSHELFDALNLGRVVLRMQSINKEVFKKRSNNILSLEKYIQTLQDFVLLVENQKKSIPVQIQYLSDIRSMGWNIMKILGEQKRLQAIYKDWKLFLGLKNKNKINIFNPAAVYPLSETTSFFVKHANNGDNGLIGQDVVVKPIDYGHCAIMSDAFAILSDGRCTFCCTDYEGELNLGNAYDRSLEEIYYGPKATYIREIEKKGKITEKRCKVCRGNLVYKKNQKLVPLRNSITDFYIFMDHTWSYN